MALPDNPSDHDPDCSLMEKMPAPPKVSVCIPTYNYADYLPLAIESVLNQGFTDFELIIRDDCSTDNTAEVVERYLSHRKGNL